MALLSLFFLLLAIMLGFIRTGIQLPLRIANGGKAQ